MKKVFRTVRERFVGSETPNKDKIKVLEHGSEPESAPKSLSDQVKSFFEKQSAKLKSYFKDPRGTTKKSEVQIKLQSEWKKGMAEPPLSDESERKSGTVEPTLSVESERKSEMVESPLSKEPKRKAEQKTLNNLFRELESADAVNPEETEKFQEPPQNLKPTTAQDSEEAMKGPARLKPQKSEKRSSAEVNALAEELIKEFEEHPQKKQEALNEQKERAIKREIKIAEITTEHRSKLYKALENFDPTAKDSDSHKELKEGLKSLKDTGIYNQLKIRSKHVNDNSAKLALRNIKRLDRLLKLAETIDSKELPKATITLINNQISRQVDKMKRNDTMDVLKAQIPHTTPQGPPATRSYK